jgi:nucleotide-binding universal stress UspA family protein
MKRILVATDFSTRSDRALRRATLLARPAGAEIVLVHVVDDDQPLRLVKAEQREAGELLAGLAATLRDVDGVRCGTHLAAGEPFEAIAEAAERADADVVVMGPHRRQALGDIFIGTTIERTIRRSRRPVIMANAVPAGGYGRVLVATDFSDCSAIAVRQARELGFLDGVEVHVVHAFEAPAKSMMARSSMGTDEVRGYVAEEAEHATRALAAFLKEVELRPSSQAVQPVELSAAETIREQVRRHKADLVVTGTRVRTGPAKFLLGSVAEDVLRISQVDVLVVPAAAGA